MDNPPAVVDLPKYHELMYPTLRAVARLGGSAKARQITDAVLEDLDPPEELVAITYPEQSKSMFIDRLDWARSYCKLGGALDSPKRGLFLISELGREILAEPEEVARQRLIDLDRQVRAARVRSSPKPSAVGSPEAAEDEPIRDGEDEEEVAWRAELLDRLHQLSPLAFENFVIALLQIYDLDLEHVGGSGDGGIDAIGVAPLSPVLSAVVAVQAKRYDPTTSISRDKVALFQRDAAARGAERAIMVTLGSYSKPAQAAAREATPTVDLIDGERICDLMFEQAQNLASGRPQGSGEFGLRILPQVIPAWFDRFEP